MDGKVMVRVSAGHQPGRWPRGVAQGGRSLIIGTGALLFLIAMKTPHGSCPLLVEVWVRHSQVLGGTHRRKQASRCCYGEFTRSTMQVGAEAASRLPSTLLGEGCMHCASHVESQVPKLSPVLAGLTLLPLIGRIWEAVSFHSELIRNSGIF